MLLLFEASRLCFPIHKTPSSALEPFPGLGFHVKLSVPGRKFVARCESEGRVLSKSLGFGPFVGLPEVGSDLPPVSLCTHFLERLDLAVRRKVSWPRSPFPLWLLGRLYSLSDELSTLLSAG